eukprot:1110472-Amorphochlora_amoeboformis.AAC.2
MIVIVTEIRTGDTTACSVTRTSSLLLLSAGYWVHAGNEVMESATSIVPRFVSKFVPKYVVGRLYLTFVPCVFIWVWHWGCSYVAGHLLMYMDEYTAFVAFANLLSKS